VAASSPGARITLTPAPALKLIDDVPAPAAELRLRTGLSAVRRAALRDVIGSFVVSRIVIWSIGIAVALVLGVDGAQATRLDPLIHTAPFGSDFLNALFAPGARFDSAWLLDVAHSGYSTEGTAAFFPLYPGLVAGLGDVIGSDLIAGIAISSVTCIGGLYFVHRLTALDFGEDVARRTVWIMACFPMAFTFSAIYTEGLFLLLSAASIYAARLGRWNHAAAAAFLAGMTRVTGLLVVVPLVLLYLYGPRADRAADQGPGSAMRPRYRVRRDAALLAAAPLGALTFGVYLGFATGNPLATFAAEEQWDRALAPLAGLAQGFIAAGQGLIDLFAGTSFQENVVDPRAMGAMNLALLAFMVFAIWLTVKAIRRVPPAYTGYAVVSLALPLSTPALGQPLMSFPRFIMVLFPLWITLALLINGRGALRRTIGGSLVLLAAATGLFVAWIAAP